MKITASHPHRTETLPRFLNWLRSLFTWQWSAESSDASRLEASTYEISFKRSKLSHVQLKEEEGSFYRYLIQVDFDSKFMSELKDLRKRFVDLVECTYQVQYETRYMNPRQMINAAHRPGWLTAKGGRFVRTSPFPKPGEPDFPQFRYEGPRKRFPLPGGPDFDHGACAFAFVIVSDEPLKDDFFQTLQVDGHVIIDSYDAMRTAG